MRRNFGVAGILFLLAAVLAAAPASAQLPAAVRVVSGNSTLKFVYDTELGMVPYTLKTGTITFSFLPESIWRVELWRRSPSTCPPSSSPCPADLPCFSFHGDEVLDASDATGFQSTGTDAGRTFLWTGIDGPDGNNVWSVAVDVEADGAGGFRWSSHITLAVADP
ncbi:MAG TPA: hypothetical protein VK824_09540, partial [Planctomycetota bacterium]|nr:hypothetical protein [Planctomycetota bacterium]